MRTSTRVGLLLLTTALFAKAKEAQSYPSFIGYGYTSCIVCHYNAFGNGPLTDYGRALGATAISGKPFYDLDISDQEYGEQSGFLGNLVKLPDFLRLSADYRGLSATVIPSSGESQTRWINMQAEGSVITKFMNDKIVGVLTLGYIPTVSGGSNDESETDENGDEDALSSSSGPSKLISREHYVSYAVKRNIRIYAGFTDVVYGIRTPDHIAVSRMLPKTSMNDQTHGVSAHFGFSKAEVGVHAFLGNLFQDSAVRQAGVSAMGEYDLAEKVRLGGSFLFGNSSVRSRVNGALHLRAGFGKGSSLLLETGVTHDNIKSVEEKSSGAYIYTQTMTRLFRGFHFLFTGEFSAPVAFKPGEKIFRVGPAIQYFPMQRLELRADFSGSRSLGHVGEVEPTDTYQVLTQVHLWF